MPGKSLNFVDLSAVQEEQFLMNLQVNSTEKNITDIIVTKTPQSIHCFYHSYSLKGGIQI